MSPLALATLPVTLSAVLEPVEETVTLPLPYCPTPVSVSAAALVTLIAPLVVLRALKLVNRLAGLVSVMPVAALADTVATVRAQLCETAPAVLVRFTAPVPLIGIERARSPDSVSVSEPLLTMLLAAMALEEVTVAPAG